MPLRKSIALNAMLLLSRDGSTVMALFELVDSHIMSLLFAACVSVCACVFACYVSVRQVRAGAVVREVKQKQILPDKQGTLQPKSEELELPTKAPITNGTSVIKDYRMRVDKLEQGHHIRSIARE